jgi:hypothetical protein
MWEDCSPLRAADSDCAAAEAESAVAARSHRNGFGRWYEPATLDPTVLVRILRSFGHLLGFCTSLLIRLRMLGAGAAGKKAAQPSSTTESVSLRLKLPASVCFLVPANAHAEPHVSRLDWQLKDMEWKLLQETRGRLDLEASFLFLP